MITKFESLGTGSTVNDAIDCLIRTTQKEFPVVDGGGRLLNHDADSRHAQHDQHQVRDCADGNDQCHVRALETMTEHKSILGADGDDEGEATGEA